MTQSTREKLKGSVNILPYCMQSVNTSARHIYCLCRHLWFSISRKAHLESSPQCEGSQTTRFYMLRCLQTFL